MSTPWATGRIGDVCRVIPGYAFKSSDWQSDGIPVVKIKNITTVNSVDLTSTDCVSDKLLTSKLKKFVIRNRDILLAMTGATAGKVGRVRTTRTLLLNQRVAKIEPVSADPDFIWAIVSSRAYQEKFFYLADGAAQPNMSGGQIEAVEIPLPPMPIQRRIAGILSAYDDLIENCQRRIQILEEMARSLYREWFVNFRYPGHESVPLVPSALGEIPQIWSIEKLFELTSVKYGKNLPTKNLVDSAPYPVYGAAKIIGRYTEFNCEQRTIICGCRGSVGEMQITQPKCYVTNNSFTFEPTHPDNFFWLFHALKERGLRDVIGGAAQPQITIEGISSVVLATPPLGLRMRFQQLIAPLFEQAWMLDSQIQNLRQTRDLLLPRLMSGQLEVAVD